MKHQHFISRRLGAPQEISRESRSMAEYAYAGTRCTREESKAARIGRAVVFVVIAAGALAMVLGVK